MALLVIERCHTHLRVAGGRENRCKGGGNEDGTWLHEVTPQNPIILPRAERSRHSRRTPRPFSRGRGFPRNKPRTSARSSGRKTAGEPPAWQTPPRGRAGRGRSEGARPN